MRNRDMQRMNRRIAREREDRQRLSEFAEAGPSFTPQSDGDGVEKNATLRQLERALRDGHVGTRPDFDVDPQTRRDIERRRPGFQSTFGPLAREQAETGNEARVRLLSPTVDRLAREAAEESEPRRGFAERWLFPTWSDLVFGALIGLLATVLLWSAVEWWLMVEGRP